MIIDPLREPFSGQDLRCPNADADFLADSGRLGSVDVWQIAKLQPLSIGRYLRCSAAPCGATLQREGLLLGPVNSTGRYL